MPLSCVCVCVCYVMLCLAFGQGWCRSGLVHAVGDTAGKRWLNGQTGHHLDTHTHLHKKHHISNQTLDTHFVSTRQSIQHFIKNLWFLTVKCFEHAKIILIWKICARSKNTFYVFIHAGVLLNRNPDLSCFSILAPGLNAEHKTQTLEWDVDIRSLRQFP